MEGRKEDERTEYLPVNPTALTIASATCLIETSSSSPTKFVVNQP